MDPDPHHCFAEHLIGSRISSPTGIFPPCAGGNIFFLEVLYQRMESPTIPWSARVRIPDIKKIYFIFGEDEGRKAVKA